jgi:poly(3-hydroxybutyrate) depolymerase
MKTAKRLAAAALCFLIALQTFQVRVAWAADGDILFQEDFEGSTYKFAPSGETWKIVDGATSKVFLGTINSGGALIRPTENLTLPAKYTIALDLKMNKELSSGGWSAGIVFGMQPNGTDFYMYRFNIANGSVTGEAEIYRFGTSSGSGAKGANKISNISNKTYRLTMTSDNGKCNFYLDGEKIISDYQTAYTGGGFGMRTYSAAAEFDNIVVWEGIVPPSVQFTKEQLQTLYDSCSSLKEYVFTTATWATLATALAQAKLVLDQSAPTSDDLSVAGTALSHAKAGLANRAPITTMWGMYQESWQNSFISTTDKLLYRLYVPSDYDPSKTYPVLTYLNGAGSRGNDNSTQLNNLAPLVNPFIGNKENPCIIVVPQLPSDKRWVDQDWGDGSFVLDNLQETNHMKLLIDLMDELKRIYNIDDDRLYLMGQSMGGYGTWYAIEKYSNLFAAAIPMCGAGDPSKAEAIKDMPLMILHGDADDTVPVQGSRDMADALKTAGSSAVYLEYPGVDHYVQRRLFEQPGLYIPWLFAQKKGQAATTPDHSGLYEFNKDLYFNFNATPSNWTLFSYTLSNSQLGITGESTY